MKILYPIAAFIFLLVVNISCTNSSNNLSKKVGAHTETKEIVDTAILPELKIGKLIDNENHTIIGTSDFHKRDRKFSYILYNHGKFNAASLTMRFYKFEGQAKRTIRSNSISVDPNSNTIFNTIDLYILYELFGRGNFSIQFLKSDSVIANASFSLK